jgi:hypothetical protein
MKYETAAEARFGEQTRAHVQQVDVGWLGNKDLVFSAAFSTYELRALLRTRKYLPYLFAGIDTYLTLLSLYTSHYLYVSSFQ